LGRQVLHTVYWFRPFFILSFLVGPMRIAIVLNTSWNIYNFRMGLVTALLHDGHEVVAIAPRDEYSPKLVEAGCTFIPLRMDSRGANPIKDTALIHELYKIYKQVRPDVILHYTIKPNVYGTLAANWLKIPVVNNVCGLGTVFLKEGWVSKIAVGLYKLAFRFPRHVFFQNIDDQQLFVERAIVEKSKTEVLPGSGLDLSRFAPQGFKRNKKFTFLLISRLIHDKGILEYIEAIKILKTQGVEARFQLLGPKDVAHKRGISEEIINEWLSAGVVEYLGTTDDVRGFIHEADCVVLPSYREGTPRTLLEAAGSGKPIIATDVPGCKQLVDHGKNGLLCALKSPEDLAAKMAQMAAMDDQSLESFGQHGRRKVEQEYGEHLVVAKYREVIQQIKNLPM
jgi:glycosyltransferase involved in cell wall biosynthesis